MADVDDAPWVPNETGSPDLRYVGIGSGHLFATKLDTDDEPDGDGEWDFGLIDGLDVDGGVEFKELFSSLDGRMKRVKRLPLSTKIDVKLHLFERNLRNAELFFAGEREEVTNPTIAGFSNYAMHAAVKPGRWYPILNSAGVQARGVATSDVVLKTAAATQVTAAGGRTLTFAASGKTITASSGSFITDGYRVGHTLVVAGTSSNNGSYTITAVTALVITVAETIVNEGALSATATLNSAAFTLVEGTDYEYDNWGLAAGMVHLLATTVAILDGDALYCALTVNALASATYRIPAEGVQWTVQLRFIGFDEELQRYYELLIPKIVLAGDGPMPFMSSGNDWVSWNLSGGAELKTGEELAYLTPLPLGGVT